jgi:hypothetical protein
MKDKKDYLTTEEALNIKIIKSKKNGRKKLVEVKDGK